MDAVYRCGGWLQCIGVVDNCSVQVWWMAAVYRCGGWMQYTGVVDGCSV